jgi:hypothetical protein
MLTVLTVAMACEQPDGGVLAPEAAFDRLAPFEVSAALDPAGSFGTSLGDPVARSGDVASAAALLASTTVVDIRTAPGPDGIPGTPDDIVFDASFTPRYQRTDGPVSLNYASPSGLEWVALGVRFGLSDGAEAFTTTATGCLGSQVPAPAVINNWDGGVGITFVGAGGVPATVSRIGVHGVGSALTLEAFDVAGNLLGSHTLPTYVRYLEVAAPGIARAELSGDFWCIGTFVDYDDLVASIAGALAQIGQLVAAGEIDAGVAASLVSMLEAADAAYARGASVAAQNLLQAFINHVNAQTSQHISTSAAAALIAWAQALAATL